MKTYGDFLTPADPPASSRAVAGEPSLIHRIKLENNHAIDFIHIPPDALGDEFPLTVIEYLLNGTLSVRVYTEPEIECLAQLRVGDPAILEMGSQFKESVMKPVGTARFEVANEGKPAPGNALQTELEVRLATTPEVIKAISTELTKVNLGQCPENFQPQSIPLPFRLADGRTVPAMATVMSCVLGNFISTTFFFPIKDSEFGEIQSRSFCTTSFKFEDARQFTLKEVQKSTKLSFHLGLGLGKLPGVSLPTGQGAVPKEGDKAFKDGEQLKKPDGNGGLVEVKFDVGLIRQYVKVTITEFRRLLAETPAVECKSF